MDELSHNDEWNDYASDDDLNSYEFDDLEDEENFNLQSEIKFHYDNLNQNDYSLNSPLIEDDILGYIQHRRKQKYPSVFRQTDWLIRDKFFDKTDVNFWDVKLPKELHQWWGKINQIKHINTSRGKAFLIDVIENHRETSIIPKVFYEGWCKKEFEEPLNTTNIFDEHILKWTEFFLMMHDLILIMNANSSYEINNLKKILKFKIAKKDGKIVGFRLATHFGLTYITGKTIFFRDHNVLIDRLFALMMKDTWIARMNTLLGMKLRTLHIFSIEEYNIILSLYKLGDKMLSEIGNDAYDAIKLLEPICNLRFCELAHQYRPLIPPFPAFGVHIDNSVNELIDKTKIITLFKDTILNIDSLELLVVVYGSFRHWGHPFINYLEGLEALHTQVTVEKTIDEAYAESLGSDLAYMVLRRKFIEEKKWYVDIAKVPNKHPFKQHIQENTWPTPKQIDDFGDHWHELPLTKCFEIPDIIDPSLLYSDKSHSMNRDEVIDHLKKKPNEPIPTKKVLDTLLHTKSTNWPEFLKMINEIGLPRNAKIIGLKGKEREVKKKGRFFSLMSWMLREYFVITEYLIKEHFVHLFNGLTMADDLTTVISKLLDRTQGQGLDNYSQICIANHIDYEKWNNHQRKEATGPVFKVMGQFLGYENLIYRTHEFFEESLIYYNGRPDLITVDGDSLKNKTEATVCWEGQKGGLEGLRQKGWTVVGLLMIRREARIRNTLVKILAQGDNQVICTHYKLRGYEDERDLRTNLQDIWNNNQRIMEAINRGTNKLGLIINNDETIQSGDYLNYGKIPVFRGRILNLFTKRLSRIMCVTNDQLLNYGNIMATVSTNSLTISHFDICPRDAIYFFNFFGNLTRLMIERHNPVLGGPVSSHFNMLELRSLKYKIVSLYLDPSLGGACGTSLTRFLMRAFPDPVTEGLSFWKLIYETTTIRELQLICQNAGNPRLSSAKSSKDLIKLLEKPESLNIPRGMSIANLLKAEIKKSLQCNISKIRNEVISDALIHLNKEEGNLLSYLWSIKPLFPRFLSEFRAATFIGITDNLVGLFQNSRTIRTAFSKKLYKDLNKLTWDCELSTYRALIDNRKRGCGIWKCSSTHADLLRQISWGQKVIGATVPHPIEMFGPPSKTEGNCESCKFRSDDYITCLIPNGLNKIKMKKGPYLAYLGSKTSETTSVLQPWEKETNISTIRRAAKLRNAIHWFINPNSKLSSAVLSILEGLTGEDWSQSVEGFKRTGSALHRFSCSRQSSGGYTACNPTGLSWMITSTDTLRIIGSQNYDFMFQSSILFGQITSIEKYYMCDIPITLHYHLKCPQCLRPIDEPSLDSPLIYKHPDVARTLKKWKPADTNWFKKKPSYCIPMCDFKMINPNEISFQIGRAGGFLSGNKALGDCEYLEESTVFPLSIQHKIDGFSYLSGLYDGLLRACCINVIHRRNMIYPKKARPTIFGTLLHCIDLLSQSSVFVNLTRKGPIFQELINVPHKTPPSFPVSDLDMGNIIRNWLKNLLYESENLERYEPRYKKVCLFADMTGPEVIGPYVMSSIITQIIMNKKSTRSQIDKLREVRNLATSVRSGLIEEIKLPIESLCYRCDSEIRHACSLIKDKILPNKLNLIWGREMICGVKEFPIYTTASIKDVSLILKIEKRNCPLITGLRVAQLATGAHYKLRGIVKYFGIKWSDFLCGGDGSGGMSAALLRLNPRSKCIYNSLINFKGASLRGASPGAPPALENCCNDGFRCVNKDVAWEEPSDLQERATWENFKRHQQRSNLQIDLIVLDMEILDDTVIEKVYRNIEEYGLDILRKRGTIVCKCYADHIIRTWPNSLLTKIGTYFNEIFLCYTDLSGSYTTEFYAVFIGKKEKRDINRYLDVESLRNAMINCLANKANKEEFDRAIKIKYMDLWKGIPNELKPSMKIQFETLFSISGVETGLCYSLSQVITMNKNAFGKIFGALIVACNSLCNTTQEHLDLWEIPSDGDIRKMMTMLLGFSYWLAWCSEDLKFYEYCLYLSNNPVVIGIQKRELHKRKTITWHIGGKCHIAKKISLKEENAGIGSWIRVLSQLTNKISYDDNWERETLYFNQKLSYRHVDKKTGILEIIKRRIISIGNGEPIKEEDVKEETSSWRS
ncbi:polymerase [Mount Elgon bat virus]|uniref:Replicase n=2 Tax=Mount Elgon bat virus TaxID=380434 RepID=A0A0D3R2H8_9RHAB|nr:polymerase [Mount Elgon bat virus]AJR28605.1 polymerase [Mount Elgon bat virus]